MQWCFAKAQDMVFACSCVAHEWLNSTYFMEVQQIMSLSPLTGFLQLLVFLTTGPLNNWEC